MYGHNTLIAIAPLCTTNKVFIGMIQGRSHFEGRFTVLFFGEKEKQQIGTITDLGSIPPQASLLANQPTIPGDPPQLCPYTGLVKSTSHGVCGSGYLQSCLQISNYHQTFSMVQELQGNRAKDKYLNLTLVRGKNSSQL